MRENTNTIQLLDVNKIHEHPLNQEIFDEIPSEKREALKISIQQNGLINPITVMAFKNKGSTAYYVVSGHNRLHVLKEEGIKQAPCKIIYPKRQGQDLDILITDNLLQRDLSILEKARAIFYMSETLKLSRDEIKAKLGISIRFIQAASQLMRLINELDNKVRVQVFEKLNKIKGINRAVQIVKKIRYGEQAPEKKYKTKEDIISLLNTEIEKRDKKVNSLERKLKRRDKKIRDLEQEILGLKEKLLISSAEQKVYKISN